MGETGARCFDAAFAVAETNSRKHNEFTNARVSLPSLPEPTLVHAHEIPCYHDSKWHTRSMKAHMLSVGACVGYSSLWACTPRLRLYRSMKPEEMIRYGEALGRHVASILSELGTPAVFALEKPLLNGFADGMRETNKTPFVLLAINGGDAPFSSDMQDRIAGLPGLRACYAMNLHKPRSDLLFPLPIGLPHHSDGVSRYKLHGAVCAEALLSHIRSAAPPWKHRDPRLLVTPMQPTRLRSRYLEILSGEEYSELVHIIREPVSFESFLTLLSEHQSTLSPPGKGHDCFRTWQAIALGTAPFVVDDPMFDSRLYADAGTNIMPAPDDLTPETLKHLLQHVCDPVKLCDRLQIRHWTAVWNAHFDGGEN